MNALLDQFYQFIITNGPKFITNLVVFLLMLLFGKIIISLIGKTINNVLMRNKNTSIILRNFITSLVNKGLWIILFMIALPKIGVNVAPLIAGVGVGGFIIGFAFQDSLSNLAAGFMLLINQPFQIGHFVDISGYTGSVKEMNIMSTTLLTPDNKRITLPNKSVWGNPITNYSVMKHRRVDLSIGISYNANIKLAKDTVNQIINSHNKVIADKGITVEVSELADSSVNFVIRMWTKTSDYWDVFFYMNEKIKEEFDKKGIEIPFPQLDVHLNKNV